MTALVLFRRLQNPRKRDARLVEYHRQQFGICCKMPVHLETLPISFKNVSSGIATSHGLRSARNATMSGLSLSSSSHPYSVENPPFRRFTSARSSPAGVGTRTSFSNPRWAPLRGTRRPPTSSANSRSPRKPLFRLVLPGIVFQHLSEFSDSGFVCVYCPRYTEKFVRCHEHFDPSFQIVDHALDAFRRDHSAFSPFLISALPHSAVSSL